MSNSLLKQQSYSVVVNIICVALSAVMIFVVAGLLGPEQFGVVGILLVILGGVSAIQHLGINAGVAKMIAATDYNDESIDRVRSSLILKLTIVVSIGLVLLLLKNWISIFLERPYLEDYFIYLFLMLVFSELSMFFESVVFALHKATRALSIRLIITVLRFVIVIFCTTVYGVEGFLVASVLTYLISMSVYFWNCGLIGTHEKYSFAVEKLKVVWNLIWETAKNSYALKVSNSLWLKVPILICSLYFSDEETGILFLVFQIGEKLRALGSNVSVVSFPYMTKLLSTSPVEYKKSVRSNFAYLIFALFVVVALIEFLVLPVATFFIGEDYAGSQMYLPFVLLAASAFILSNWINNFIIFPAGSFSGIIRFQIYSKVIFIFLLATSIFYTRNIILMLVLFMIGDILAMIYFYLKSCNVLGNRWLSWNSKLVVSCIAAALLIHGYIL